MAKHRDIPRHYSGICQGATNFALPDFEQTMRSLRRAHKKRIFNGAETYLVDTLLRAFYSDAGVVPDDTANFDLLDIQVKTEEFVDRMDTSSALDISEEIMAAAAKPDVKNRIRELDAPGKNRQAPIAVTCCV